MDETLLRAGALVCASHLACCATDTLPEACVQDAIGGAVDAGRTDAKAARDSGARRGADGSALGQGDQNGDSPARDEEEGDGPADAASRPSRPSEQPTTPADDPGEAGACAAGYTTVGDTCVCDLNGTFALRGQAEVHFAEQTGIEGGSATSVLWAIVQQAYDDAGELTLRVTACGQDSPEICGTGLPPLLGAEAYGLYSAAKSWRHGATDAAATVALSLPRALPGESFLSPEFALLHGMDLDDASGAWPGSRADVEGGREFDGSAVNGARWADHDDDDALGVTTLVVPPGGIAANGSANAPSQSYPATSSECPRADPDAARSPYAYLPLPEGLSVRRIKRVLQATRFTLALDGKLDSCDRVAGHLAGPNDGRMRIESRVAGCTIADGSNESACDAALLDLADMSVAASSESLGTVASFVMKRADDDTTCAAIRELSFD